MRARRGCESACIHREAGEQRTPHQLPRTDMLHACSMLASPQTHISPSFARSSTCGSTTSCRPSTPPSTMRLWTGTRPLRCRCLPASLPTCLPACLPARPPICAGLPACQPASLPACTPACLPAGRPASLPARLHACTPACLPACLPASLPTCLPARTHARLPALCLRGRRVSRARAAPTAGRGSPMPVRPNWGGSLITPVLPLQPRCAPPGSLL